MSSEVHVNAAGQPNCRYPMVHFAPPRRRLNTEALEPRRLLATIAGTVAIDLDSNHRLEAHDNPVPQAIVWIDRNGNSKLDTAVDLTALTDEQGRYAFENLEPGTYQVRYQAGPGLAQTSPYHYFGWKRNASLLEMNLVTIDFVNGTLTEISPATLPNRAGLIKTIDGEFFAAGHLLDTIVRIDPVTGTETQFPTTDKQFVAGLAYDPIMDELYTLASDTESDVRKLYRIDRSTAEISPVAESVPDIPVARGTSALTFNWITRELISFNNENDTFFSYDLLGNARQLGTFSSPFSFYNLSFDGVRYLAHRSEGTHFKVYEVDPFSATALEVAAFEGPTTGNAAEILAANEPHTVTLESSSGHATADFLAAKLKLQKASISIGADWLRLADAATGLDITHALPESAAGTNYCIGAAGFQLTISSGSTAWPISLQLSPEDDVVEISNPSIPTRVNAGEGVDSLRPLQSMSLDLSHQSKLESIEVVDLRHGSEVFFFADPADVRRIADGKLRIEMGPEDTLELNKEDWNAHSPAVVAGQRVHQLVADQAVLEISNDWGWQNPLDRLDVNRDRSISPLDAMLIIDLLNQPRDGRLNVESDASAEYVDVSGDHWLTPLDALIVINELNRNRHLRT